MTITSGFVEGDWASAGHRSVIFTGSSAQTYDLIDAKHNPGLAITLKLEGTGAVTLTPVGSQTIDGQASFVLATQYSQITVVSDGSNWLVTSVQNGNAITQAALPALSPVSLTDQTAAITATNLVTAALAGVYRVTVDLIVTTVGTAGTLGATIAGDNGAAAFSQASSTASLTVLGAEVSQTFTLYSAAGQNITYATALAGATGTPAYSARFRVEYLG